MGKRINCTKCDLVSIEYVYYSTEKEKCNIGVKKKRKEL